MQTASTKEERENGYEASYLGNLKEVKFEKKAEAAPQEEAEEDLPF